MTGPVESAEEREAQYAEEHARLMEIIDALTVSY